MLTPFRSRRWYAFVTNLYKAQLRKFQVLSRSVLRFICAERKISKETRTENANKGIQDEGKVFWVTCFNATV